jgi:molybdate transport system substrate-binding protein
MPIELQLLCAGAAQGLVHSVAGAFRTDTGATVGGRFGAVGALKEALLSGAPCDLMITTDAMVDDLVAEGRLRRDGRFALGRVRTGIAVRRGTPLPDVSTPDALAAALGAADAIYLPDPQRATAGIHFARVLGQLGLEVELAARLRPFPNGATAMRELAASTAAQPIGCTQISEILYTEGVTLVAPLPPRFELATTYTAAVATLAAEPALAARLIQMLAAPGSAPLRQRAGFEPPGAGA